MVVSYIMTAADMQPTSNSDGPYKIKLNAFLFIFFMVKWIVYTLLMKQNYTENLNSNACREARSQ